MNQQVFIVIVLSIVVFFLLREFWCWYFKINKRYNLMEEKLATVIKVLYEINSNLSDKVDSQNIEPGSVNLKASNIKTDFNSNTTQEIDQYDLTGITSIVCSGCFTEYSPNISNGRLVNGCSYCPNCGKKVTQKELFDTMN